MIEERTAITRLQQGNLDGLEVLVSKYYFQAVRTAYLILHDKAQAEDIAQDAFVNLQEKIHQYDPRRPFGPWFLRCVVNASLNAAKKQARWVPLEPEGDEDALDTFQAFLSDEHNPEEIIAAHDLHAAVWDALTQLSPNQRAVIVMRYFLDLNESEMGAQLASPPSSIKWWLRTARQRLHQLLSPSLIEEHPRGLPPQSSQIPATKKEITHG